MNIQDLLELGQAVCDTHYDILNYSVINGVEVEVENEVWFELYNDENHSAHRMVKIALDGLVDNPQNKIAYVAGFVGEYAICVFSYDGTKFCQFKLKLKGK